MKIDKDLYGIGWVTDRAPTQEETYSEGFCTLTQEAAFAEPCVYYHQFWVPGPDIAWRNNMTIKAAKLAKKIELITWSYDTPDHTEHNKDGFVAQTLAGYCWNRWDDVTVRWTTLSLPDESCLLLKGLNDE